jgi:hypothetical protein
MSNPKKLNTGVLLIMFILLGLGITMLVYSYEKTKQLNNLYVKLFQKDPPESFLKVFIGIGWGLTSIAALVIGLMFFFHFRKRSNNKNTINIVSTTAK